MKYLETYTHWVENITDENEITALRGMTDASRQEMFAGLINFGTAGLRGKLSLGTNAMNRYTVALASTALAEYMGQEGLTSIVIGYDNRLYSSEFAVLAGDILRANGVTVYTFDTCQPTPYVSYCVRKLRADMGIMITASHNPKEYNGYKVFDHRGCQIGSAVATRIADEMSRRDPLECVAVSEPRAERIVLGDDVVDEFLTDMSTVSRAGKSADVTIIYSPLCGTGHYLVPEILRRHGYTDIHCVPSQIEVSPLFETCPKPNPELPEAYEQALALSRDVNADILLLTDPDCDRIGCMVRTDGGYVFVNGNALGQIFLRYILSRDTDGFVVTSVVTSPMAKRICAKYGVPCLDSLTGFKNIADRVDEALSRGNMLFAYEESHGYMPTTFTRDKDGVSASLLLIEICSVLKAQGKTIIDYLDEIRGSDYMYDYSHSVMYEGAGSMERMRAVIGGLRGNPPTIIAGKAVVGVTDYLRDDTGLEKSDFMRFSLAGRASIIVRPSGTEPKLKFYSFASSVAQAKAQVDDMIQILDKQ